MARHMFENLDKRLNGQTLKLHLPEGVTGTIAQAAFEDTRNKFTSNTREEVVIYLDNGWRRILSESNKITLIMGLQTDDLDLWEGATVRVFLKQRNRTSRTRKLGVAPDDVNYDPFSDEGASFTTEIEVLDAPAREGSPSPRCTRSPKNHE